MNLFSYRIAALAGLCFAGQTAFGQFSLNAVSTAADYAAGTSNVAQGSSTISTTPASNSAVSVASIAGVTTTESIAASLTDPSNGSITFNDGWNTVGIVNGAANVSGLSSYSFSVSSATTIDVAWNASFVSNFYDSGFGLWNVQMFVDGTQYVVNNGKWLPPAASGSWLVNLGAGAHTVQFQDFSNISGALGTQMSTLTETLNFSIAGPATMGGGGTTSTPSPAAALPFALGLLAHRRRRA